MKSTVFIKNSKLTSTPPNPTDKYPNNETGIFERFHLSDIPNNLL